MILAVLLASEGKKLEERLFYNIDKNGSVPECRPDLGCCWVWTGYLVKGNAKTDGYGCISIKNKTKRVSRVLYSLLVEGIPDNLELDHLCRNPPCVRPSHLEPVTHKENTLRGNNPLAINARKTHCIRGHPLSGINLGKQKKGRFCKICDRIKRKEYRERHKIKLNKEKR